MSRGPGKWQQRILGELKTFSHIALIPRLQNTLGRPLSTAESSAAHRAAKALESKGATKVAPQRRLSKTTFCLHRPRGPLTLRARESSGRASSPLPPEVVMRAMVLLVGGLALLVGACSDNKGGKGGGPVASGTPPLNKELLVGKWKADSEGVFTTGYEFDKDNTLKMTIRGMKEPVPGTWSWSGERTLDVKYKVADIRKDYEAAVKAYKSRVNQRVKSGELTNLALPSLMAGARDELPAEEKFVVSIVEKPRWLMLNNEKGGVQQFE
jgi:hypothetical protein